MVPVVVGGGFVEEGEFVLVDAQGADFVVCVCDVRMGVFVECREKGRGKRRGITRNLHSQSASHAISTRSLGDPMYRGSHMRWESTVLYWTASSMGAINIDVVRQ